MRRSSTMVLAGSRRIRTQTPLPRLPAEAFVGPRTLESSVLPRVFLAAFGSLLAIQAWLALVG